MALASICSAARNGSAQASAARRALFLVPVALWAGYEACAIRYGRPFGLTPAWLDRRELPQDYVVGLLFAVHLLGLGAVAPWLSRLPTRAGRAIEWLAGATFTVYLFHFPVMAFLRAIMPVPAASWDSRLALLTVMPLVLLAIAEGTERRKQVWRRAFTTLLPAGKRAVI